MSPIIGVLVPLNDNNLSQRIRLIGGKTTIGRKECDVVLSDRRISRSHATFLRTNDEFVLVDERSHNGTRVNGVRIARRRLMDGDRVDLGGLRYVFALCEEEDPDTARVGKAAVAEPSAAPETRSIDLPTMSTAAGALVDPLDVRMVNAWQTVRALAHAQPVEFASVLQRLLKDVVGSEGVHRTILHLAGGVVKDSACWIRQGAPVSRPGTAFPETRMLDTLRTNVCDQTDVSVCCPVCIRERASGFLYVEFPVPARPDLLAMVRGMAEAIGLVLALRTSSSGGIAPGVGSPASPATIVGHSAALQQTIRTATRVAASDSTVLLRGESGSGKEVFARLIYEESRRRNGPFVPVHCSAVEETLLGSTLFGHEKGAFTGAVGMRKGLFEAADRGTVFLDEVGELSLDMQVKLLRVLQEREFLRVGGNQPVRVDVRVIAATNRNLEQAIRDGRFREDLFFRLNVITLTLPPLRARAEDIPDLVGHFIAELSSVTATSVRDISDEAMQTLLRYDWPGNVRELRNVIERALVLAEGATLTVDDLPSEVVVARLATPPRPELAREGSLDEASRAHIRNVLQDCGGNKRLAAQRLGISRSTLYEKLKDVAGSGNSTTTSETPAPLPACPIVKHSLSGNRTPRIYP